MNGHVSVGEAWVLLLSLLSTIYLVWRYCKDNQVVKNLLFVGLGAVVLAYLFSAFVIPFNFCIVQLIVNFGVIIYLGIQQVITKSYKYLLIILFTIAATGVYYTCHFVFSHKILPAHQQTRIEVLLGKNNDLQDAGYNVNQAKIAIGSGGIPQRYTDKAEIRARAGDRFHLLYRRRGRRVCRLRRCAAVFPFPHLATHHPGRTTTRHLGARLWL